MYSICFDCRNARADKCRKIFDGTPINGWVADRVRGGGYVVKTCPNFKRDKSRTGERLTVALVAHILHISERSIYRYDDSKVIKLLKDKGYSVAVCYVNGKRVFTLSEGVES